MVRKHLDGFTNDLIATGCTYSQVDQAFVGIERGGSSARDATGPQVVVGVSVRRIKQRQRITDPHAPEGVYIGAADGDWDWGFCSHDAPQYGVKPVEVQTQDVVELLVITRLVVPWGQRQVRRRRYDCIFNKERHLASPIRADVNTRSAQLPRSVELV